MINSIYTPPENLRLDFLLLRNILLNITKLSKLNLQFAEELRKNINIILSIKRYINRLLILYETQNATIALLTKKVTEQSALLYQRKIRTKKINNKIEEISVYNTAQVL